MTWFNTPEMRRWTIDTWRYYSWRSGYSVVLNPQERTGYIQMQQKLVVCNPEAPYPPAPEQRHVRHLKADTRSYQLDYLQALLAHEAGHAHYSGALPSGALGQLVNSLEDQRIEYLMREDFPELRALFTMANDADLAFQAHHNTLGGDLLSGCLTHRLAADHPRWAYQPPAAQAEQWREILPLLEGAWVAPTFDAVVQAARAILSIAGIDENAPRRGSGAPHPLALIVPSTTGTPTPQSVRLAATPGGAPHTPPAAEAVSQVQGDAEAQDVVPMPFSARPALVTVDAAPLPATISTLQHTEADARALSRHLDPRGAPDQLQYSSSRGRFRFDRYCTQAERPFQYRTGEGAPHHTVIRLAVDCSQSMHGPKMDAARQAAFTLIRAAHLAGVPVKACAFHSDVLPLCAAGTGNIAALNKVSLLQAQGSTRLAPALEWLRAGPPPEGFVITVVISDGELGERDQTHCRSQVGSQAGLLLPILINASPQARAPYQLIFGRCVELQHPGELRGVVLGFLRTALKSRRRAGRP